MQLIGNYDNEEDILMELSLDELRQFCQTNNKINNFCRTSVRLKNKFNSINKKIDHVINQIDNRNKGVILQTTDEIVLYQPFAEIVKKVNFRYDHNYDNSEFDEEQLQEEFNDAIFYRYYIIKIIVTKNKYGDFYAIAFNVDRQYDDHFEFVGIDYTTMYVNKKQLKEILLHFYFDNMILNL